MNYLPVDTIIRIEDLRAALLQEVNYEYDNRVTVIEGSIAPASFTVSNPLTLCRARQDALHEAQDELMAAYVRVDYQVQRLYDKALMDYEQETKRRKQSSDVVAITDWQTPR